MDASTPKQSVKPPASSSVDLVAALLEDDVDPKDFAYNALPSAVDDAWNEVERRVRLRLKNANMAGDWMADHATDIALEVAGEVAVERGLDKDNHFMWRLQSQAARFRL